VRYFKTWLGQSKFSFSDENLTQQQMFASCLIHLPPNSDDY
jgi:hypothetical protein